MSESVIILQDLGGERRWEPAYATMPVWVGPVDIAEGVADRLRHDRHLLYMLPQGGASVVVEDAGIFTLRALRDARRLADAPEPSHDAPEPVRAACYAAVKAETWGVELLRCVEQHELTGGKLKKRTRRRRTAAVKPLTELQQQAVELYAKHNGRVADVAREMGVTHATVHGHLKAAWRKLPELVPKKVGKPAQTRRLPTDRRGQVNL